MSGSLPSKFTRAICEEIARRSLAAGAPANSNPTFREIDAWILGFKRGRQIQRNIQTEARPQPCQHEWRVELRGDERLCLRCQRWEQLDVHGGVWRPAHDTARHLRIAP